MGKTCKEYQDDLKINAINDKNAKKDKEALEVWYYLSFFVFLSNNLIYFQPKETDKHEKGHVLSRM